MSSASHGESLYQTSSVATVCLYSAQPFPSPCHLAKLKKKKKKTAHICECQAFLKILKYLIFILTDFACTARWILPFYRWGNWDTQILRAEPGDFPGSPAVGDFTFQCRWCGFDPWLGIWAPTGLVIKKPKHMQQREFCNKFNKDFKIVYIKKKLFFKQKRWTRVGPVATGATGRFWSLKPIFMLL